MLSSTHSMDSGLILQEVPELTESWSLPGFLEVYSADVPEQSVVGFALNSESIHMGTIPAVGVPYLILIKPWVPYIILYKQLDRSRQRSLASTSICWNPEKLFFIFNFHVYLSFAINYHRCLSCSGSAAQYKPACLMGSVRQQAFHFL